MEMEKQAQPAKVTPEFLALVRTIIQQNIESLKELAKH